MNIYSPRYDINKKGERMKTLFWKTIDYLFTPECSRCYNQRIDNMYPEPHIEVPYCKFKPEIPLTEYKKGLLDQYTFPCFYHNKYFGYFMDKCASKIIVIMSIICMIIWILAIIGWCL